VRYELRKSLKASGGGTDADDPIFAVVFRYGCIKRHSARSSTHKREYKFESSSKSQSSKTAERHFTRRAKEELDPRSHQAAQLPVSWPFTCLAWWKIPGHQKRGKQSLFFGELSSGWNVFIPSPGKAKS
jgi:hypothetical protein